MGWLDFHYDRGGICLPALGLWLDPAEARKGPERVFVSHAHSDHTGRHREVILTEATARLMQARLPGPRVEHCLPWREVRHFQHREVSWSIALFPAGHILGSAMARIEAGGESLLYTGDFKLRPGLSAEPCEPVHADGLIMETTFGRPRYLFPRADEVIADVLRFCREGFAAGETPVLQGYSLGKSQEILALLERAGLPAAVHPQVDRLTRIYRDYGWCLEPTVVATAETVAGRVVVCPPGTDLEALIGAGRRCRRAVLTGWALDSGARYRYGVEAAFPLSDHADFDELVTFVRAVAPRGVWTVHGFAAEFAAVLRDLGFAAQALSEPEQLTLNLGAASWVKRPKGAKNPPRTEGLGEGGGGGPGDRRQGGGGGEPR